MKYFMFHPTYLLKVSIPHFLLSLLRLFSQRKNINTELSMHFQSTTIDDLLCAAVTSFSLVAFIQSLSHNASQQIEHLKAQIYMQGLQKQCLGVLNVWLQPMFNAELVLARMSSDD